MGMTIGKLIVQRDNFKVDETYQRPPDAWSNKDKQCFIDTILRNEPVPLFFINEKDEDGKKSITSLTVSSESTVFWIFTTAKLH